MAIRDIIAKGIGFSPGTLKWIVTHGFGLSSVAPPAETPSSTTTTIASQFQSLNLPILVSDALWTPNRRAYIDTLFEVEGFTFSISSWTGYDQCSFGLHSSQNDMNDWILNGLGRHIVVKNESLVVIWEGFVNTISFSVGAKSVTIGPLLETGNKVAVQYSVTDNSTSPPTTGTTVTSAYEEDATSQEKYGIIEQTLSQGGVTQTLAETVRAKYLKENKNPPRSTQESYRGGFNPSSIQIDCLGYYYFFDVYNYSDTTAGEENLSVKLLDVIAASPNDIYSSDTARFETNTVQVATQDTTPRRAKMIIEDLVPIGDASNNRFNFGVYANRQIIYEAVVSQIEYIDRLNDVSQTIEDRQGNRVFPWNVLPGKWKRTPDFLVGRSQSTELSEDLRNMFIVKTSFSAPWELTLTGDELEEMPQLLAKVQRGISLPG